MLCVKEHKEENTMAVKSAARVMDVLDVLRNHPDGMTLQELCNELNIPKSSMHEILHTMTERNYLNQSENKRYSTGFKLIELGLSSLDRINVYQSAKQYMVKPVSYTHLRAHETRHDLVCRLL